MGRSFSELLKILFRSKFWGRSLSELLQFWLARQPWLQAWFSQLCSFFYPWALILGIPTLIIYCIISKFCSDLPQVKHPHEGQRNKLLLWLYFYLIMYWVAAVLIIFCDPIFYSDDIKAGNMTEVEATKIINKWLFWSWIATIISYVGLYYFIVCSWSQIPKDIARISPHKAAWFSLIPVFNFYGWFVTFRGLLEDMNKTAQQYGQPKFVKSGFAIGICIFWVGLVLVLILFELQGEFSFILLLVDLIFTTAFFVYLYNNLVRLIAMKPADKLIK
ncbi:MAG: hypothetical protein LBE18_09340 [Planctomycetaceae bacterium]|jgi:hypothetical protein|nr:hypothetical protein [Planctomycetaceae bacterium]